jgi:MoxR-like ATPase
MYEKRFFNPEPLLQDFRTEKEQKDFSPADRRDGKLYLYTEKIVLAVNVALATGRPLLVRGASGCGKSSLAYNLALCLKRRYYEFVVSSRTEFQDLLWRFDAVRRLADAQAGNRASQSDLYRYMEPGVLWWIFDRESVGKRGIGKTDNRSSAKDPVVHNPDEPTPCAVLLIDEIDKAEPDFPNNLLVPLGSLQFSVPDLDLTVRFKGNSDVCRDPSNLPLVIITTNEERELPGAFLRRCVVLRIDDPTDDQLLKIAEAIVWRDQTDLHQRVLGVMNNVSKKSGKPVSIAEFHDAIQACEQLKAGNDEDILKSIVEMTGWKHPDLFHRTQTR